MPSGATLQLVSYGAQDMYLTGNPQITYFKVVYRRHTNFSMEDVIISRLSKKSLSSISDIDIPDTGDLVYKIALIYKAQHVYAGNGLANPTTALIDYVTLNINGNNIDTLYGHWIETWYELTKSNPNGTCTNISNIDENSICHLSSALDIAVSYAANASLSQFKYYDNRLNKLTNILGVGVSYPPTKFQKNSLAGGCYCRPTYLQELFNDKNLDGSSSFISASSDFMLSVDSVIAQDYGNDGYSYAIGNSTNVNNKYALVNASEVNLEIETGSPLGLAVLELPFWCCKDPGLAIPLCALQNSNITLILKFADPSAANFTNTLATNHGRGSYMTDGGTISNENNVFNAFKIGVGGTEMKPLIDTNNNLNFNIDVSVLYIYLDSDEKKRFAQVSHEYLIEQVQYISDTSGGVDIDISSFHHPVKEIIWTGKPYTDSGIKYYTSGEMENLNNGNIAHKSGVRFQPGVDSNIKGGSIVNSSYTMGFGNGGVGTKNSNWDTTAGVNASFSSNGRFVVGLLGPSTPTSLDDCDWSLSLNHIPRTSSQPLQEYTRYNVDRYHTGYGSVSCPDSIAVYSFALKPEDHQPSGTCNFSKIDIANLHRYQGQSNNTNKVNLNIYAVNYNILRFMGGLCGLAYNL